MKTNEALANAYEEAKEAEFEHMRVCHDQDESMGCDTMARLCRESYDAERALKENPAAVAFCEERRKVRNSERFRAYTLSQENGETQCPSCGLGMALIEWERGICGECENLSEY